MHDQTCRYSLDDTGFDCSELVWKGSPEGYCIFHEPDKGDDFETLQLFHKKIHEKLDNEDYNFTGFVFPENTGHFRGRVFKRDVIFRKARFLGSAFFSGVEFRGNTTDFTHTEFLGSETTFDGAKFCSKSTDFVETRFMSATTNFTFSEFSGDTARFSEAQFMAETIDFNRARFASNTTYFIKAVFSASEGTYFTGVTFSSSMTSFMWAKFTGPRTVFGADFLGGEVHFQNVKFLSAKTDFQNAKFQSRRVDFKKAEFVGTVIFIEAFFSGDLTNFYEAKFHGDVTNFDSVKFTGQKVIFSNTEFCAEETLFYSSEFSCKAVEFIGTRFCGDQINFSHAEFSGQNCNFSGAKFSSKLNILADATFAARENDFRFAEFSGELANLSNSQFSGQRNYFNAVKFTSERTEFFRTIFSGETVFFKTEFSGTKRPLFQETVFYDIVRFGGADLKNGCSFANSQFFGYADFTGAEFPHPEADAKVDFTEAEFMGQAVIFRNVDMSRVFFNDFKLQSRMDMTNAIWPHERYFPFKARKRFTCAEEKVASEKEQFESAATTLRALESAAKANHNPDLAGDFAYGRNECNRKTLSLHNPLRCLFLILGAWYFGYGQKISNVLISSAIVISLFACVYLFNGICYESTGGDIVSIDRQASYPQWEETYPTLKDYSNCLYFSTITFTTLGYGDMHPANNIISKGFSMFEALLGAFTIAVFAALYFRRLVG